MNKESNQSRIFRMISPAGFVNLFWEEIKICQKSEQPFNYQQIFDALNEEYRQSTGKYRYKNYETFKIIKGK